jgi:antitoxin VapB
MNGTHKEIEQKLERIHTLLDQHDAQAILLSRHGNIAWITAGQVEARVALGMETAVCSLLMTRDGRSYYIAPNNEAARLADEEFAGLNYEGVLYPWHENPSGSIRKLIGQGTLLADSATEGAKAVSLTGLQTPLLPQEIERYRRISRDTADATVEVLENLAPGMTEQEMAARTAAALWKRGIAPTVLLMGTDNRIFKYKHAVPRAGVLERYGMVNLCARRFGLIVSITRFVYFGPLPPELAAAFQAAADIHAAILHATKDGTVSSEIFAAAQHAYAKAGAGGEIERHHQGGSCGYGERDWVITPKGTERVTAPQAFAYNPSLHGAKAEDTALLAEGKIEVLTTTPKLPILETVLDGVSYRSAGVLARP